MKNSYLRWPIWAAVIVEMIFLEELYFKTICEVSVLGINPWNINRLFPPFLLSLILATIFVICKALINKDKISPSAALSKYFNSVNTGVIALLSMSIFVVTLAINSIYSFGNAGTKRCMIVEYITMSGGKTGNDYPSVLIKIGVSNKQIALKGLSQDYVYSKKYASLKLKKGGLGWDTIQSITLE